MKETEKLHFKIGLAATFWRKLPKWEIQFDKEIVKKGEIDSNDTVYVEFDHLLEDGPHVLSIQLKNKLNSDTVENADKTEIVKDLLLHIRSIEIDEIDLGQLLWSKSRFVADDTTRPTLGNCVDLGWNGSWELSFDSPFYIWLLENM
jgi:hypothetical protein